MRDLRPRLPALVLSTSALAPRPGSLAADVQGLASDVKRRFAALEAYCAEVGDVQSRDPEFGRLDALVTEAVDALVDAPARDLAGVVAKARAVFDCAAIEECMDRSERVAISAARDVVRLFGAAHPATGDSHHAT